MRKYLYILVVFLFVIGLGGCDLFTDYTAINEIGDYIIENTPDVITKDFELITDHPDYEFEINYLSDDLVISNEGIVFKTTEQSIKLEFEITYDGLTKKYSKEVIINALEEMEIFELIAQHVVNNLPKSSTENVSLIKSYLNYDLEIEYASSDEEAIDSEGIVTRSGSDKVVTLYFNIKLGDRIEGFNTTILIPRVESTDMKKELDDWLDEHMADIIASEEGELPTKDGKFGIPLRWYANQPGVVGGMNNLNVAFVPSDVTLVAEYKLGYTTHTKEFEYKSKGLKIADKNEYIDNFFKNLIPEQLDYRTNLIYDGELDVIQSIVLPNTVTKLRPGDSSGNGVAMPGGPMWVVIHDTGNPGANANAEMHNRYIHNQANSPTGRVASWHYTIDDTEVYQHVPDTEQAWHAGDNDLGVLKYGNRNGIGIETCINPENDYELTLRRTAKLTAQLLYKYNLGLDNVVQHWHFSQKNCPAVIRGNGWWQDFKDMVARELFLIIIKENKDNPHVLIWTIDKPEVLSLNGAITKTPINDEEVTITLEVNIEGFTNTYTYNVFIPGMNIEERFTRINHQLYNLTSSTVTGDIVLPAEVSEYEATIKWYASHPEILDSEGKYNKPEKLTIVRLTAAITINNKTVRKVYNVAVS